MTMTLEAPVTGSVVLNDERTDEPTCCEWGGCDREAVIRAHVRPGTKKTSRACSCNRGDRFYEVCQSHFEDQFLDAVNPTNEHYLACRRCNMGELVLIYVERLKK